MDLRQLAALIAVAETGSVTIAARMLHLVQPAVSRRIRQLEDELGVPLFDRTRHGMTPTPAGHSLLKRARRILAEVESAESEFLLASEEVSGIVTIGLLESVVDLIAEPLVTAMAHRLPNISLRIMAGFSGQVKRWMDSSEVDMAILYNLPSDPQIAVVPLLTERLWAVAPPSAQLDPNVPVTWEEVFQRPVILPVPGHGLRILIDRARLEFGGSPDIAIESNSMHLQKLLVLRGVGWTVLPACGIIQDITAGTICGAPLAEPEVVRTVVLALRRELTGTRAVDAVASKLAEVVRAQVSPASWPSAELIDSPDSDQRAEDQSWATVAGFTTD